MKVVQIRNQAAPSELAPKCLYRRPSWFLVNLAICCIYRLMYPSEITRQFLYLWTTTVAGNWWFGAGRKCISSVTTSDWRYFFVRPKTRPVKKTWMSILSGGKLAQRWPFLKYAVTGKVWWVREQWSGCGREEEWVRRSVEHRVQ